MFDKMKKFISSNMKLEIKKRKESFTTYINNNYFKNNI